MPANTSDRARAATAAAATGPDWSDEMKVTFDSGELASFFDGFAPLLIGDDGVPVVPTGDPES
jgi:hypothetical protein